VVSDIEGNFYALQKILKSCGVIDDNYNWIFGNNHFMVLGDLIDRGINVIACLSLIYKLDHQAKASGGVVHCLLGNHELMNFSGDFRYVHRKYRFNANGFDTNFQPLFNPLSLFAHWLLSKNTVEIIGDYLFAHAGVSRHLVSNKFSIEEINKIIRTHLGKSGYSLLRRERLVFGEDGPLWYRGYISDSPFLMFTSGEDIEDVLRYYNAKTMVVGHTVVPFIKTFYQNKLIAIDIHQPEEDEGLPVHALMIEDGKQFVIDDHNNRIALGNL
jgi:hypothetical protein